MSHQINELKVHAFRQLKNIELHGLGRVNLLVGVNNSGKTSVLEAIAAHCRPLEPLEWIAIARRREVKSSREPVLDVVRWLFPQHGAEPEDPYYEGQVRVESEGKFPNIETRAWYRGIVGAPDEDEYGSFGEDDDEEDEDEESSESSISETSGSDERGADISLNARVPANRWLEFEANHNGMCSERFRLWETRRYVSHSAPSPLRLPVATISPFSHRVRQAQVSQLSDATLKGRKFSVIEVLRLIDPDIEDLEILSRTGIRPTLYVHHKKTGFTPLSALGDGVRRVLAIALNLSSVQHGVLLIDEIETAIHKDALATVFQWLVRACKHFDVQLFTTTHSLEAIDAMLSVHTSTLNELIAFRLPAQRSNEVPVRYSGDTLRELRHEGGMEVR